MFNVAADAQVADEELEVYKKLQSFVRKDDVHLWWAQLANMLPRLSGEFL